MGNKQLNGEQLIISKGDEEAALYIRRRIREHNMQKVPLDGVLAAEPLNIILKDTNGNIVGGINAIIIQYWGKCHIDIFWIEEQYRGMGYGSNLLRRVEEIALERGCTLFQVDTYSFQAPQFYIKNGYEIFGTIENCPPGHSQYFLKKLYSRHVQHQPRKNN
jgi:GNAT superfamily N-acetyltransferase